MSDDGKTNAAPAAERRDLLDRRGAFVPLELVGHALNLAFRRAAVPAIGPVRGRSTVRGCGATEAVAARPGHKTEGDGMAFEAYHGVTGADHQTRFNKLSAAGFRMISLSVHGDAQPRYSAVWVQRGGSGWVAVHGVDAAGYQQWFNTWTARGYAPVLVSATGTAQKAVFAAVMEQGVGGHWEARHGLTSGPDTNPGTFEYQNKAARAAGLIPRSVAIYGTASARRYAGSGTRTPASRSGTSHASTRPGATRPRSTPRRRCRASASTAGGPRSSRCRATASTARSSATTSSARGARATG